VAAIAAGVRRSIELREIFANRLADARRVLEQLPEMRAAHEMCAARRARCVAWYGSLPTLNAWNFASTGNALPALASKWTGRLSDVIPPDGVFRGNRFARIPCQAPHGANLYSQRDAFLFRPVPRRVLVSESQLADLTAPVGSLLLGGQGTLGEGEIFGRAALVTTSIGGSAISEHLLRIQPHREARGLVYAFLSTHVGLRLVRSTAAGTKLLSLRPDLLKGLPLPVLGEAQLRAVNAAVADALEAHEAARVSEDEAILKVEQEVLPQWLA
jgi:type I restriction enzyme S subunit